MKLHGLKLDIWNYKDENRITHEVLWLKEVEPKVQKPKWYLNYLGLLFGINYKLDSYNLEKLII